MTLRADGLRILHMARCEGGAIAPIVGVMLPVMFGMLGLVEAGKVYGVKNQLQATADAAAMASVRLVGGDDALVRDALVRDKAIDFAEHNMPALEQYNEAAVLVDPDEDVEIGEWDPDRVGDDRFRPGVEPPNAVRVTTLAEMPLFFAGALQSLGVGAPDSFIPSAQAIALLRLDKCYMNGFVAGGTVHMNSQNHFAAGYCVYGRNGVTMNNSNEFAPGTGVGMLNLSDLVEGGNNPGLLDALVQKDISAPPTGRAEQLIQDLFDGGSSLVPDYITSTTTGKPPSPPVSGTMYIYDGTDQIELSGTVQNIAVISNGTITIKSNSNLRNVVLATRKSVDINSNVDIGDQNYCDTGEGTSLIISGGAVTDKKDVPVGTNSNISLHGVQVVVEGTMEMNSNLTITGASVQATTNIVFNSRFQVAGCPDVSPNVTGDGTKVAQLVD